MMRRSISPLGKQSALEMDTRETKLKIIAAGQKAVEQLIKVAESDIIKEKTDIDDTALAADRLKNAAATKKLAIFDALEILNRIDEEREALKIDDGNTEASKTEGWAERNARKPS